MGKRIAMLTTEIVIITSGDVPAFRTLGIVLVLGYPNFQRSTNQARTGIEDGSIPFFDHFPKYQSVICGLLTMPR